jgi:hypothetical protein
MCVGIRVSRFSFKVLFFGSHVYTDRLASASSNRAVTSPGFLAMAYCQWPKFPSMFTGLIHRSAEGNGSRSSAVFYCLYNFYQLNQDVILSISGTSASLGNHSVWTLSINPRAVLQPCTVVSGPFGPPIFDLRFSIGRILF